MWHLENLIYVSIYDKKNFVKKKKINFCSTKLVDWRKEKKLIKIF